MAANITYNGGTAPDAPEVLNWGGLEFVKDVPVLVDPDAVETGEMKRFYEYMIIKARTHPALTIEDVPPAKKAKAKAKPKPAEPAEDDYPEEKPLSEQNHKTLIARAHRAGAPDSVNSKEDAIAWIEAHPDA